MSFKVPIEKTILVAEDEPGLRKLVGSVLKKQGYDVLLADDGSRALKVARKHDGRIDLLVTDLMMPAVDGFDLRERFLQERPGVPILVMSGALDDEIVGEDFAVLRKPFQPEELASKVSGLIGARV